MITAIVAVIGHNMRDQERVKSPFDFCKVMQQVRETPKVKRRLDPFSAFLSLEYTLERKKLL